MTKRLLLLTVLALSISSAAAADDKDLLKKGSAPPNLLIVFGNSQTMEQPIEGASSAWDGDADSPASKLGAAKLVIKQFVGANQGAFNIGLTSFAHNPNSGSITLSGKHWLYSPLAVDYPGDTFQEPVGTIERWGLHGEGPCTNLTVPLCTDRSPNFVTLSSGGGVAGPFFGSMGTGTAVINISLTQGKKGAVTAGQRIQVTLTAGTYGDAFTDGSLSTYTIASPSPPHAMAVHKVYQEWNNSTQQWTNVNTPRGNPGAVTVFYAPSPTLTSDLFYTTNPTTKATCASGDPNCGQEIGFLNDPQSDFAVSANCSGWEFQVNAAQLPLVKIPRDYCTSSITSPNKCSANASCAAPQNSFPCVSRLLRPQAKLVAYASGTFTTADPDNPGYTISGGNKYQDGCDPNLLGAVNAGLNITENQAILTTRNGSQAPIKDLLTNIYQYFTTSTIDGFQNGKRLDDPNKACRKSGVVLIYDNFNGCQNDSCNFLTNFILTKFKQIGVPVYVIGFGASAVGTSSTGICIAQNTGAVLSDGVTPGYFPVSDANGLYQALTNIASILDQSPQTFATSAVSTTQAFGSQVAFFGSFSPSKARSIWNGRLAGYKLTSAGNIQLGQFTISDPNDPNNGAVIPVPSNDPSSLIWNAAQDLAQTPGTGATVSSAILAPGAAISTGSYSDQTNDGAPTTIPTSFYPGRKIVFSLPQVYTSPVTTLPIPAGTAVPENRYDMTYDTSNARFKWVDLKALLGPQTNPPNVLSPALTDVDAGNSLRFIWGDRDAVTGATDTAHQYLGQKLGDVFHSGPLLIGSPNDFAFFQTNTHNYQSFFNAYQNRRRVLYVGANDGLLHAFDAGAFGRDNSNPNAYDLGTGAELFAFAPRAIMQIYKPLKDAVGPQTKQDEWTVDLSPSAADVFISPIASDGSLAGSRSWHTVLVGGVREGSPFEGTSGSSPKDSQGSYFALDVTQPDELVGTPPMEGSGSFNAPKCLNQSGDGSCARDWPTVLWEITDTGDLDAAGSPGAGYPDMGETWSKAAMGRVKVCTASCGTSGAVNEDHYVAIFGGGFDRERKNRRGNWLYMVDVETGKTLYRANSSCGGDPVVSGCTPTYFGSIPSGPTAVDFDGDGYLDLVYVGDLKGQLWRVDLTALRKVASPPGGRFRNQLDLASGSGAPFLFFQAGPASLPNAGAFYPVYFRPEAINLGFNVGGRAALGIAFGTGDRDDILAKLDPTSLTYPQRFYYVVDAGNTVTRTESDLLDIASPTAAAASTVPAKGWMLELINGERVVGDTLTASGIIRFPAFNPTSTASAGDACSNVSKCSSAAGTSRLYQVLYTNGNAYPAGSTDRGQTQSGATFITAETGYIGGTGEGAGLFWSGGAQNPSLGTGRRITVRSWKEKTP